jgi:hypothetical protein
MVSDLLHEAGGFPRAAQGRRRFNMGNEQAAARVAEIGEDHPFSNQSLKPLLSLIHLHGKPLSRLIAEAKVAKIMPKCEIW